MNCPTIQRHLLACERPGEPPDEVRDHLAGCAECRALQRRLLQLEQQVRRMPTPPSRARGTFVLEFLAQGEVRPLRLARPGRTRERVRGKVALAFALAAGLAVFALSWWAWPHHDTVGPSSGAMARGRSDRPDRREPIQRILATAHSPRERVRGLAAYADDLHHEAERLTGDVGELREVAAVFGEVVREHLLAHARLLPAAERPALLAYAQQLQRTESEAARVAASLRDGAADAAVSFAHIASAARQGSRDLLALARVDNG
jgi:hypothetical protein